MADDPTEVGKLAHVGNQHVSVPMAVAAAATATITSNMDARAHQNTDQVTAENQNANLTNALVEAALIDMTAMESGSGAAATGGLTTAPATSDDDFESDDDDDSRSNHSTKNTSNSNSMIPNSTAAAGGAGRNSRGGRQHAAMGAGETKQSHHNVLERKRRDLLKDSFALLRESVPRAQPKERISRAEILKQAAEFIQSTVKRNASVRDELDELIRRNREFDDVAKKKRSEGANTEAATTPGADGRTGSNQLMVSASNELSLKQEL